MCAWVRVTHAHACLCTHAHARAHTNAQVRASCETSAVTVWMNGSAHYAQSTLLTTFSKMTAKSEHYIFDRSVENEALDWIQARARAPAHKERQPGRQTRTELGRFVGCGTHSTTPAFFCLFFATAGPIHKTTAGPIRN